LEEQDAIRLRNSNGVSRKRELVKSERNHDLSIGALIIGYEIYSKKKRRKRGYDEKTKRRNIGSFMKEIRLVGKWNP